MSIATLARQTQKVMSDNAPAILTGVGIAGTVVTTLLVGRAGYKAGYKMQYHDLVALGMISDENIQKLKEGVPSPEPGGAERFKKVAKATWKLYLPSAVTGVGTIASIAAANRIGANRMAGLAAAYTITDRAFSEYKTKVGEVIGEKKRDEITDKVMQDRINNGAAQQGLVVIGDGKILCYDATCDRYFSSNMEEIKKAVNDANYELIHGTYLSLNEFYDKLGLPNIDFGDEVGWISDNLIEVHFSPALSPKQEPALAFTFHVKPIRNYNKAHGS